MPRRIWNLLAFVPVFTMLGGCDRGAPSAPAGTPAPTPRLAVLSPALAQTIRDLGAGDRIVARHGWDSFTPSTIPPAGDEGGIDYEALLKSKPTCVVMQSGAKENLARLDTLAAENHWTIVRVPALTLDDIASGIAPLAHAAGMDDESSGRVERTFREAFEPVEGFAARAGRVLVLAGVDPPSVMGPGSFHFELIERLGGDAIPDQGAAFIQWSVEDVLKADPDTLVLMHPGATSPVPVDNLGPLVHIGLRCVNDGRVVVVSDPKCHLPATSLASVANSVRDAVMKFQPLGTGAPTQGAAR